MSEYQDTWLAIKGKMDDNSPLNSFLGMPIVYMDQDIDISKMPTLVVGFGTPSLDDLNFAMKQKKTGIITLQPKLKVQHHDNAKRALMVWEGIELLFNCFDANMVYGTPNKIIKIPRMQVISITTMGEGTLEAITEIDFQTQPFTFGNR